MNLAENAEAYKAGKHPGWVDTAWAGLQQSIEVIAERNIKVVINGGSLNPSGLAQKVALFVSYLEVCMARLTHIRRKKRGSI